MWAGGWWPDGFRSEKQNGWFSGGWSIKSWSQGCVCVLGHHMTPTHKQRPGGAVQQRPRTLINTPLNTKQKADKHKNPATHTNTHVQSYTTMWFHIWNSSINTCMLQKIHNPIDEDVCTVYMLTVYMLKIYFFWFCKNALNQKWQ